MDKHYSEQIIEILVAKFGWTKTRTGIAKSYRSEKQAGQLNPDGEFVLTAGFCDRDRYLELFSGFNVVFDMDCRDLEVNAAAKKFDKGFKNYVSKNA